ncbi:MAG: endolytic transglycosylase MltG [Candidatus Saganbacteria bacterium]|nr:endolytic transglycosylase MltG [Candidatus Saganbacteria bacterium]
MKSKIPAWILSAVGIGFLISLFFVASLLQSANPFDHQELIINVPKGASTYRVENRLEDVGVLRPDSSFAFMARVLGVSKNIKAGRYLFSPSNTLLTILIKLKSGQTIPQEQIKVTFPEGTSIYKMGEILKKNKVSDYKKFQSLVSEGITEPLREKYWGIFKYIPSESLEGYLYPDTYWFYKSADAHDMADIMLKRFVEVVMPFWKKAQNDTKYNLHEILTLASIIEKEAKVASERAIISSVYHNRLKIGMALGADPTIKYALDNPTKKVYTHQLEVDSPYNTYRRRGLPPGPICNPGIESIKAAVYPAKTNYFYFVAKEDGSHIFSRTLSEHQKARGKVKKLTPTQ